MKIVVYIFAAYLIGLNFLACNDLVATNTTATQITQVSTDHSHDHQDACSPFCQCHCCHVHVAEINPTAFSATNPEIRKPLFFHLDNSGWEIPKTLLQPPRV